MLTLSSEIYTAIKYTVSNGDVAPFVGHNAILRWSAIQSIGYFDEDGYEKFWSEAHVSEDFEMSLKYAWRPLHAPSGWLTSEKQASD